MTTEKKTMVTLAAKQQAMLLGQDVGGKHGGSAGSRRRADGRVITIQVNAWYK